MKLSKLIPEAVVANPYSKNTSILARPGNVLFRMGDTPPMWNIIFTDKNGDLQNERKRREIIRLIDKHLKQRARMSDMDFSILDPDTIMKGLQYYPHNNRLIIKLPKFLFKSQSKPTIDNSYFGYEAKRIIPDIEIQIKK